MISWLKGSVIAKNTNYLILNVNNVGYKVFVLGETLKKALDEEITLFTFMKISQEDISIYGFNSQAQLNFFELLLGVSGIGPKVSLSILDQISISDSIRAILEQDIAGLTKIKGLGKKNASRIIVDLRDKIYKRYLEENKDSDSKSKPNKDSDFKLFKDISIGEKLESEDEKLFVEAMIVLGFSSKEANSLLEEYDQNLSLEENIKKSLRKRAK